MCMMVLPFFLVTSERNFFVWMKILLCSSIGTVLVGDIQFVLDPHASRIAGTLPHPNILAFYMIMMIVVGFYLLKSPKSGLTAFWRRVLEIYVFNLFFLLILTKTRNAWIACWLMFFIYGVMQDRKYFWISVLLPPLALLLPPVQTRIADLLPGHRASSQGENSWDWRVHVWKDSMEWIVKKPIFGYGLMAFYFFSKDISSVISVSTGAHNTYIEVLFEMGVVGLLFFLSVFLSPLKIFWKRSRVEAKAKRWEFAWAFSYLLSYLLACFADNMNYYLGVNWYTWFFIGLMLAAAVKNIPAVQDKAA